MSKKVLVAYFSASGVTARTAKEMADAVGADLYEIRPEQPYSSADLNWMDKKSRSTLEMNDSDCRPAIAEPVQDMAQYDTVLIGFPIWWYVEPRIVDTFLESYDFSGKTMIPFATSGGSGIGKAEKSLQAHCPNASWIPNEIVQNTGTEVDFGFFPWPSVEGGVDGAEASMVGAQGFGIVKESDMQQEAFDFATMIATGDYDLEMASSVNSIPADTENTEWPDAISEAEPYFKEMTKAYDWAVGLESNADFTPVITENVVKLIQGNITPDDFVQALADAQ